MPHSVLMDPGLAPGAFGQPLVAASLYQPLKARRRSFTYGTMFGLEALAINGEYFDTSGRARRACEFLLEHQQQDGGWGESYKVSQDPPSCWVHLTPSACSPVSSGSTRRAKSRSLL